MEADRRIAIRPRPGCRQVLRLESRAMLAQQLIRPVDMRDQLVDLRRRSVERRTSITILNEAPAKSNRRYQNAKVWVNTISGELVSKAGASLSWSASIARTNSHF
jgi:hypothetical protein